MTGEETQLPLMPTSHTQITMVTERNCIERERKAWVESRDCVARANTSRGIATVQTHKEAITIAARRYPFPKEKA